MTPKEKGSLPIRVEKLFYELQDRIFSDIVRRIRKTGKITSTADYQINKLLLLGDSTEFIESELKRLLTLSDPEIWEMYDKVCEWEYVRNRDAYEQINGNFTPLEDNDTIQGWSQAIVAQTQNEIKNLTRSLGMTVDIGGGKMAFTPLAEYYQKHLDRACMDVVTGSFDYNTVLRRVVKELSASGLQVIDYSSGWRNRAPVAARRAVLTGVSQLSAQINEQVAKDLKTDKYEVSWHSGHRPSHWWGGRVYTYQELQSVCGLGEGDGLCGWNCRHSYYAFLEGYSIRTYTDEQLDRMEEKEQSVRTYRGKEYNAYQASQAQRKMETTMRAQRAKVRQLQQGDGDKDDIIAAKARYLNTLHQYQAFSKKMELPEQMERVYMDGLGRVITDNRISTLFPQKMVDNMQRDLSQYKKYKKVLGKSIGSLDKFGNIKYNDSEQWEKLQKKFSTYQEIDGKNWSEEFKTKSKLAYGRFEKEDIVMSVHALSRLPRLNKPGIPEVSENELIEFIHGFPNYREGDNKLIYFDHERQLLVVKNTMTDEIISVVRRKSLKEEWRSV